MRYVILFKVLLISILSFSQTVTVKGKIENPLEQKIRFIYANDIITSQPGQEAITSKILDGTFSAELSVSQPDIIYFAHGPYVAQLYVQPNTAIEINFDAENFYKTIFLESTEKSKANSFLAEMTKIFADKSTEIYGTQQTLFMKDSLLFSEYVEKERTLVKEKLSFLETNTKKYKLTTDFVNLLRAEINYGSINTLYQMGMKKRTDPLDKAYNFMNEINLNDPTALKSFNYHLAVKFKFQHDFYSLQAGNNIEIDKWFLNKMYDEGSNKLSGEVKEIFIASTVYTVISNKWEFLIDSIAPKFFNDSKNKTYINQIKPLYDAYLTEKNKPLPDGAIQVEGEYKNIEELLVQYKGKVVYIDVWASWCGPCKREMPFSVQLQEKLKGKEIVFLFIAVNDKSENWKNAIKQLEITGNHYFGDQNFSYHFMNKFEIKGIPRYLIADKTGKIVNPNAPRPSHEGIQETLIELLK